MKQYIAELEARVEKLDKVKVTKELVRNLIYLLLIKLLMFLFINKTDGHYGQIKEG